MVSSELPTKTGLHITQFLACDAIAITYDADAITILCCVKHSTIPSVTILKNQTELQPVVTF